MIQYMIQLYSLLCHESNFSVLMLIYQPPLNRGRESTDSQGDAGKSHHFLGGTHLNIAEQWSFYRRSEKCMGVQSVIQLVRLLRHCHSIASNFVV